MVAALAVPAIAVVDALDKHRTAVRRNDHPAEPQRDRRGHRCVHAWRRGDGGVQ